MTSRTVVVTGASGFLGWHTIDRLRDDGWHVRALTRRPELVSEAETVYWNGFSDTAALLKAMQGADAVVHLAAHAHVFSGSGSETRHLASANVSGVDAIADMAVRSGVRRVLLMSSVAARDPLDPNDHYGRSKREGEDRARGRLANTDTELVIVRPPMIYGERMKGRPLRLFQLINRGFPVPVAGRSNERSIAYAGNVAMSVSHLLDDDTPAPESAIYAADAVPVSTANLVRLIASALDRKVLVLPVPRTLLNVPAAIGSITRRVAMPFNLEDVRRAFTSVVVDNTGAFPAGGPPFSTVDGLRRTAIWLREHGQ